MQAIAYIESSLDKDKATPESERFFADWVRQPNVTPVTVYDGYNNRFSQLADFKAGKGPAPNLNPHYDYEELWDANFEPRFENGAMIIDVKADSLPGVSIKITAPGFDKAFDTFLEKGLKADYDNLHHLEPVMLFDQINGSTKAVKDALYDGEGFERIPDNISLGLVDPKTKEVISLDDDINPKASVGLWATINKVIDNKVVHSKPKNEVELGF